MASCFHCDQPPSWTKLCRRWEGKKKQRRAIGDNAWSALQSKAFSNNFWMCIFTSIKLRLCWTNHAKQSHQFTAELSTFLDACLLNFIISYLDEVFKFIIIFNLNFAAFFHSAGAHRRPPFPPMLSTDQHQIANLAHSKEQSTVCNAVAFHQGQIQSGCLLQVGFPTFTPPIERAIRARGLFFQSNLNKIFIYPLIY